MVEVEIYLKQAWKLAVRLDKKYFSKRGQREFCLTDLVVEIAKMLQKEDQK